MADDRSFEFDYADVHFSFIIDSDEQIISQNIEATGGWEQNQLSLYSRLLPAGGVFVDIGANVGINSIFAAMKCPGARIIAVEPEPRNFRRLVLNTQKRDIELHNLAIADETGMIGFGGTGTNAHIQTDGEHQVPCEPLDKFIDSLGVDTIDLLKIDVEGFTDMVLAKSASTMDRTKVVIVEYSYGDIINRLNLLCEPETFYINHSEELFDKMRPYFAYFYYISRSDGLVLLNDTKDLFDVMFSEAVVGDVLGSRVPMPSISTSAFIMRSIIELKRQNHLRMVEIATLQARS